MKCEKCGGRGKIFVPALNKLVSCEHCRKEDVWEEKEEIGNVETEITKYERFLIPDYYKGIRVDGSETVLESLSVLSQYYTMDSINRLVKVMDKLWGAVYNGDYVKVSLYLYLSNYVDMKQFVYSFQKLADMKGFRIVPYISANQLYGVQKARDVNVFSLLNGYSDKKEITSDMILANDGFKLVKDTGFTYYDYISADICFIEATANTTDKGWIGLADLLSERSKLGLPTYVVGYYHSENPYVGNGKYLFKPEGLRNRLDLLIPYNLEYKSSKYNKQQKSQGKGVEIATSLSDFNLTSKDILSD